MIWPHSSSVPLRTFTWQLVKNSGLHMKLQYWVFSFFLLLQLLWAQIKCCSNLECSVDTVLRLKGLVM